MASVRVAAQQFRELALEKTLERCAAWRYADVQFVNYRARISARWVVCAE